MLSIFRRNHEEESEFIPVTTGRLETTYSKLRCDFGDGLTGRLYDIDISEFTSEFIGSIKVPRKIQECVRQVLDDYLKAGEEYYFQLDEKTFGVFFGKATKAVAELKVQVIRNELGRSIEDIKRKRKVSVKENCGRVIPAVAVKETDKPGKKGTLPDDLAAKEMRDWASRAMANMVTSDGYENFQADVERLSQMIKVHFKPLWYVPNGLVSGYVIETIDSFSKVEYREKQSQEDLAILAAAIRHLKEMTKRKECALMIVPVFLHTICDRRTRDLFNIYCHSIDPQLKRFLVFRIKGLDSETLSKKDWDTLNGVAGHCRSVIIEAPKKKIDVNKLAGLNFHAVGIDISNIKAPEEHILKLLDDFARFYQRKGKSTYILGVEKRSLLLAAIESGHPYISGPAIAPFLTTPRHASYLQLEDMYAEML